MSSSLDIIYQAIFPDDRFFLDYAARTGEGATTHMLVELYLDLWATNKDPEARRRCFFVEVHDVRSGKRMIDLLHDLHHKTGLRDDVDLGRVHFFSRDSNVERRFAGERIFSWAVFADHSVKDEGEKPFLIYRAIRALTQEESYWRASDRDGNFLMALSDDGKKHLLENATCPVTVTYSTKGQTPVTWPASIHPKLQPLIRLRKGLVP